MDRDVKVIETASKGAFLSVSLRGSYMREGKNASCVSTCPRKALKNLKKNVVIFADEEKCDACSWRIQARVYESDL